MKGSLTETLLVVTQKSNKGHVKILNVKMHQSHAAQKSNHLCIMFAENDDNKNQ